MNPSDIPTPRTDAQNKEYARRDNDVKCVSIDFARQLEQELNDMNELHEEDKEYRKKLEQELQQQFSKNADLYETFNSLTSQLANSEKELQQAREESEGRRKLLSELEAYHFELEQKLDCMKSVEDKKILQSIVSLQSQLSQAKEEFNSLKILIAQEQEHNHQIRQQLSQWQECAREIIVQLKKSTGTLGAAISSIETREEAMAITLEVQSQIRNNNLALFLFTQLTSTTTKE